jgi:D-amino-acid dehydrogenase
MSRSDVVIIGGGAIGLSSAYYLNRAGYSVTILDDQTPDQVGACSWGNAGMVCPSHFVPLAAPGVVKQGLKWLMDPESPFSIEFSPSLEMIQWLWQFRKAANPTHVKNSANILRELGMYSRSLFKELDQTMDFGFTQDGILMLCSEVKTLTHELSVSKMARDMGMDAIDLDSAGVAKTETGMNTDLAGGVYYPLDCHVNPVTYLKAMKKHLTEQGVSIHHGAQVTGMVSEKNNITEVRTKNESWEGDHFVLAAGAFSSQLINPLGLKMPLLAGKGYSITMASPPKKPALPAILVEARIASTPMGPTWRFGGTMTVTQRSRKINNQKLDAMLRAVSNYYPDYEYGWTATLEPWVGLRPLSADGIPYIGSFQKYPNLIAATGHAMIGVSLSTGTGHLVADIVSKRDSAIDLAMLKPDRFI